MNRTPALISGVLLTSVGLAFNASYGWQLGGSDMLRAAGMAGVFIACVGLKDWMLGYAAGAVRSKRWGLAAACSAGLAIGCAGSFLAAFGSATEGRSEKADPRAAQITAFKVAEKTATETEKRLASFGDVPNVADAKARASALLSEVDPGIAKRTAGCTSFPTENVGKRVQAVNRDACQPVVEALALAAKADEASALTAKLDAAREVLAKGAPKAADPLENAFRGIFAKASEGIDVAAWLSLLVAAIVELGAPVSWAIWQMSESKKPEIPRIAVPVPANSDIPTNPFPGNPPSGGRRGRKADPKIIQFSERFREKHGRPPSGSEIKMKFPELPTSTAYDYAKRTA